MNKINLLGRIATDLEIRENKKQKTKVLNFTVAVPRRMNREITDFINVSAWNSLAEHIEKHFDKGQRIAILGELRVDRVEKDGETRTYYNVVAEEVDFCESVKK